MTPTKVCTGCETEKPVTEFGINRSRKRTGRSSRCLSCLAAGANARYHRRRAEAGAVYGTAERFLVHVRETETCWLWTGRSDGHDPDYGRFMAEGVSMGAHRWSYLLHYGDLPAGAFICHHCDRPGCVRPDHLYAGDVITNVADMVARGRMKPLRGEANPSAVLTTSQVIDIRRRLALGTHGIQAQLAREYGVSQQTIHRIVHRKKWKHIA